MDRMSDGWFAFAVLWTATAGTALSNGVVHSVLWLAIVGAVLSAICPWGLIVWSVRRRRRGVPASR